MAYPIGVARGLGAGIVWGAAFDKTLAFGFPMLAVKTYPSNRPGASSSRAMIGGELDAWTKGSDRLLSFRLPAIPPTTEADPYGYGEATGWDDADGWLDFLAFARAKNTLRFAPVLASYASGDPATWLACKLRDPWDDPPGSGWNTRRDLTIVLRSLDDFFETY